MKMVEFQEHATRHQTTGYWIVSTFIT